MLNEKILKNEERVAYELRSLYASFGYTRYKMSKFEEYDLYVRNKDFLISQGIITFTDTNGKLLALKPDVTLSIIKNSKDTKNTVQKLYYDENVYRTAKDSGSFKEIAQTGLECIGDVELYHICEVLTLAVRSLEAIDSNFILDISHAGLLEAVLTECGLDTDIRKKVMYALQSKNSDELDYMCRSGEIGTKDKQLLSVLIGNYSDAKKLTDALLSVSTSSAVREKAEEFGALFAVAEKLGISEKLNIDFSIIDATGYYSGVVFKGYIKGIPTNVLSGGQYDKLMKKMGKNQKAIGFAVYLDTLERHNNKEKEYDYDYVIVKSGNSDISAIIAQVQKLSKDSGTVITVNSIPEGMKYKKLIDMTKGDDNGNA